MKFLVCTGCHVYGPTMCFCMLVYIYYGSIGIVGPDLLIVEVSRSPSDKPTLSTTPLDERSFRRRELYLTTHSTHKRQISMPRRDSKSQSQQASDCRETYNATWYRSTKNGEVVIEACYFLRVQTDEKPSASVQSVLLQLSLHIMNIISGYIIYRLYRNVKPRASWSTFAWERCKATEQMLMFVILCVIIE
jgi:hypothetical protein